MPLTAPYPYAFAMLYPSRHPDAAKNDAVLTRAVLGIEVTEPELAVRCSLGNLDPQHGPGATATCAIEAALTWALPQDGTVLATIRPDADAFGAMAVLSLRRQGRMLDDATLGRVALIALWDRFALGSWHAWVWQQPPLPRPALPEHLVQRPIAIRALGAIARDAALGVDERVALTAAWLCDGSIPQAYLAAQAATDAELTWAWNHGAIIVSRTADTRVIVVRSARPETLALGYRFAPVVIAEGMIDGLRKVTIAQFEGDWIDMAAVLTPLAVKEPGWGGSPTIIGSPQGTRCRTPLRQIVAAVLAARQIGGCDHGACEQPKNNAA